jgi:pimeloyl-ACP methyl ester carboxylesterase
MDGYGPAGRSRWLDVDWNEHRRYEIFAGRRVNLVEIGSGPPLVFVHGLAGSWTNWLENICEFADDHRVIALDLPGFGASEITGEAISIQGYARLLEDLCAKLEIASAAVVGSSMGGLVSAELALRHPQRVERLCLVSAAGLSIEKLPLNHVLKAAAPLERVFSFYGGLVASRAATLARRRRLRQVMMALVAAHPGRLPAPLAAELVAGAGRPGLLPGLQAMSAYPIRDRLAEIACPTFIVWGDRDRLVPMRDAGEFERLIPGARKIIYPDTGHLPMLERPACFNEDLRTFLEEEPGERVLKPGSTGNRG